MSTKINNTLRAITSTPKTTTKTNRNSSSTKNSNATKTNSRKTSTTSKTNTKSNNSKTSSAPKLSSAAASAAKSALNAAVNKTPSVSKTSNQTTSSQTSSTSKTSTNASGSKSSSVSNNSTNTSTSKTPSTSNSNTKVSSHHSSSTSKTSTKISSSQSSTTPKSSTKTSSSLSSVTSKTNTKVLTALATSKTNSPQKGIIETSNLTSNIQNSIISAVKKYIVDAPAIYTKQALKSTLATTTSTSKTNAPKDYIPGMPSDAYKKFTTTTISKYHGKNVSINMMLANLDKDKSLKLDKDQKTAMLLAGEKLLNANYDPKFVAGVLANIKNEGTPGQFESSYYKTNPDDKPFYLRGMDKDFNYREEYSGKSITEVGIKKAVKLQKEASQIKHTYNVKGVEIVETDKFGFGMCQFTGSRAGDVLNAYEEFYEKTGINNPTKKQCLEIEVNFMMDELNHGDFSDLYTTWKKDDKTAYNAGYLFCIKYEKPKNTYIQAKERGNNAKKIYNIMNN